jgi:hypothetical protein
MKAQVRTDPHRPGAIMPCDYTYILSYSLPVMDADGNTYEYGMTCAPAPHSEQLDCCLAGLERSGAPFFQHPSFGAEESRCQVCGATFRNGDVWFHQPTGQYLRMGHDCSSKYSLLADRSQWAAWHVQETARRALAIQQCKRKTARFAYLAAKPELEAALELGQTDAAQRLVARLHGYGVGIAEDQEPEPLSFQEKVQARAYSILQDMNGKLLRFGSLSEKQEAYAVKLAQQLLTPVVEEAKVPAPEGRLEIEGTVVSVKTQPGFAYGSEVTKLVIKVQTPEGSWAAWVTCPGSLFEALHADWADDNLRRELKGARVAMTVTLTRSDRDAHFAFGKRPAKARFLDRVPAEVAAS